jgi:anti-sigma B factor antagonist
MNINYKETDGIIIVECEGNVDSKTAPEFEKGINLAIDKSKKIIVDFTHIDFLSSAGLRVLLLLYRKIKAANGQAVLTNVKEEIIEVMGDTGFIKFFILLDSVDAAIQSLK